jgi:redox-sensitive bicupin YhaK (pirin superfamily)
VISCARAQGDLVHGIQAWVALPKELEETEPAFHHHPASDLPGFDEAGASGRLIAGRALGMEAAVKVHSPMFYIHCTLTPGARIALPDDYTERAAYIVSGEVEVDGNAYPAGRMLVFKTGDAATLKASAQSVVMLLGGEPVGPRFIEWNFVSSSKERIEQAKADWRAGRMKLPDLDNGEFIPLPPDPGPSPNPMS